MGHEVVKRTIINKNKTWNMKRHAKIASVLVVVAGVMLTTSALALYYTASPFLPPPVPYFGPSQPFTFESTALTNAGIASVYFYNLKHLPGTNITYGTNGSGNYWDIFDSTLTGTANITFTNGTTWNDATLTAQGSTTVTVMGGYSPGATGGWTTSLSILNWPAAQVTWGTNTFPPIYIQCPAAPGQTTVQQEGQGYVISSSFYITPEISLDDSSWTTADQSGNMTLESNQPPGIPGLPTLSEWGLIVLALLLVIVGTLFLLRHRRMVPETAGGA